MLLKSFFNLFYPALCANCSDMLLKSEKILCLKCYGQLPFTNFNIVAENPIAQLFYGRVQLENAMAMCYYEKGGIAQHLVHLLKYKGRKDVGLFLGKELGLKLAESPLYSDVDAIIPVPLHKKKEHKRGYNQSLIVAEGISNTFDVPVFTNVLMRAYFTETQTKKNRWDRYNNVKDMFVVSNSDLVKGKHLLVVDDVITTGATIEACVKHLLEIDGVRVSVAGLASSAK